MAPEWVNELYQASIRIDDKALLQLVDALAPEFSELAKILRQWIDNFRYDLIIEFAEPLQSVTPQHSPPLEEGS